MPDAPSIVAMPVAVPPGVDAIDNTALCGVLVTVRYFDSVEAEPVQLVAARAVRRSSVSFLVSMLEVNVS